MATHKHHHPLLTLSIRTRSRTFGTLNFAVALRGASCGWGTCNKPRRTFVGHHRINVLSLRRGIEVDLCRDPGHNGMGDARRLLTVPIPLYGPRKAAAK